MSQMGIDMPCPRCGREVRTIGVSNKLYRHLDPQTDDWCTQEPKRLNDLMIELLDAVSEEREVIADVANTYLEFSERIRAGWNRHTASTEKATALVRRITDLLKQDLEAERDKYTKNVAARAKKFGEERVGGKPDC